MFRSKSSQGKKTTPLVDSALCPTQVSDVKPDTAAMPTIDYDQPKVDGDQVEGSEGFVTAVFDSNISSDTLSASPKSPQQIDEYKIIGEIARGGMGIVYKAWDDSLKCHLALKTIRAGEFADEHHVERFRREAEATAKLRHPHIVQIHRVGQSEGLHYFTMDFVSGPTLSQMIRERPLTEDRIVRLTLEICDAIAYAHRQGILHRDLKPSNVLTDEDGRALVTDFGLAKRLEDDSDLSHTGQALGTPSYMPPEQAIGRRDDVGVRSDVYSIGALLFHLLTGSPPFVGESFHAVIDQVLNEEVRPPRKLNPEISRDLDTICIKCMQKDPDQRYDSVLELMADLERHSNGFPIHARPISSLQRAWSWCLRNPAIAAMVFVTALTLTGAIANSLYSGRQVKTNLAARRESARQRLEAEMKSIALTAQSSQDTLMASRAGLDADKLSAALDEYEQAESAWTRFTTDGSVSNQRHFEIALSSYRTAKASRLIGDLPRCEAAFKDAINRLSTLVELAPTEPEFAVQLGEAWDYLGESYRDHDRPQKAHHAYSESLRLLRQTHKDFPEEVNARIELARAENNSGLLIEDEGKHAEATEHYLRSKELLTERVIVAADDAVARRDLARSLINLGRMRRLQKDFPSSQVAYTDAIDHLRLVLANDQDNRRLQFLLAVTERNLGYMLSEAQQPEESAKRLEEALGNFEQLPTEVPEYQLNHVICLVNLTNLQGRFGGTDGLYQAQNYFQQSLRRMRRLQQRLPGNAEYQSWLAVVLGNGAAIAQLREDIPQARQRIDEAIEYQRRAVAAQPKNTEFRERLMGHEQFAERLEA